MFPTQRQRTTDLQMSGLHSLILMDRTFLTLQLITKNLRLGLERSHVRSNALFSPVRILSLLVFISTGIKIFFVLTEQCDTRNEDSPCDQMNLGPLSFDADKSFIAPFSNIARTSPGHRITKHIDPQSFTTDNLRESLLTREKLQVQAIEDRKCMPPSNDHFVVTVYIYCPPCACQIATALDICQNSGSSPFIKFTVRVDHFLPSTCCASAPALDGVCSIIDHLRHLERIYSIYSNWAVTQVGSIDREWLEEREYAAEDTKMLSSEADLARIALYHDIDEVYVIVIIGEDDFCMRMMDSSPFPPFDPGHKFRDNMMFEFSQQYSKSQNWHWVRRYLGTYSTKAPIIRKFPPLDKRPAEGMEQSDKRPRTSLQG